MSVNKRREVGREGDPEIGDESKGIWVGGVVG